MYRRKSPLPPGRAMMAKKAFPFALLLMAVSLSLPAYHFRPRSAWDRATPRPIPRGVRMGFDYLWLSEREALCLVWSRGGAVRAVRRDMRTWKETGVVAFFRFPAGAFLSPDAAWLLWDEGARKTTDGSIYQRRAYRLTPLLPGRPPRRVAWRGPAGFRRTNGRSRDIAWLRDGKGWVEICWPPLKNNVPQSSDGSVAHLVEYRRDSGDAPARNWPLPPPAGDIERVLGVTPDGRVLAATDRYYDGGLRKAIGPQLLALDYGAKRPATLRAFPVPLPPGEGWYIVDATLSPDGRRVAWLYSRKVHWLPDELFARLGGRDYEGVQQSRLIVTDTRGGSRQELGQRDIKLRSGKDMSGWFAPRWKTDNKRLSLMAWDEFTDTATLWTLPTD